MVQGRHGSTWQKGVSGFLMNKERRDRRDLADTLNGKMVRKLIKKIDLTEEYTKLDDPIKDAQIRQRNKAMIALPWIWPKRGSEYLRLQLSDISYEGDELVVSYHLKKKAKHYQLCENDEIKNAKDAKFCKNCATDFSVKGNSRIVTVGVKDQIVKKRKNKRYWACKVVIDWIEELRKQTFDEVQKDKTIIARPVDDDTVLFPPFRITTGQFDYHPPHPMTVQNFNHILQGLDSSLFSHAFRFGHAEVLFQQGYNAWKVKKAGDWESDKMPQEYAKRKGLTIEDKEYSDDLRDV